jgi:hypothetical protein
MTSTAAATRDQDRHPVRGAPTSSAQPGCSCIAARPRQSTDLRRGYVGSIAWARAIKREPRSKQVAQAQHACVRGRPHAGRRGPRHVTAPPSRGPAPTPSAGRLPAPSRQPRLDGQPHHLTAWPGDRRGHHRPAAAHWLVQHGTSTDPGRVRGKPDPGSPRLRRYAHLRRRNHRLPGLYLTFTLPALWRDLFVADVDAPRVPQPRAVMGSAKENRCQARQRLRQRAGVHRPTGQAG